MSAPKRDAANAPKHTPPKVDMAGEAEAVAQEIEAAAREMRARGYTETPEGFWLSDDGASAFYLADDRLAFILRETGCPLSPSRCSVEAWEAALRGRVVEGRYGDPRRARVRHLRPIFAAFQDMQRAVVAIPDGDNLMRFMLGGALHNFRLELNAVLRRFNVPERGDDRDPRRTLIHDLLVFYALGFNRDPSAAERGPTLRFVNAVLSFAPPGSPLNTRTSPRAVIATMLPDVKALLANPERLAAWCSEMGLPKS